MSKSLKLKPLPLGKQTFKEIIEQNNLYVDKTEEVFKLLDSQGKYFFLSRPRRFGKSLLISTLEQIFLGNKELFKGLYIYDKIAFKKYPVIKLTMNDLRYSGTKKDFEISLIEHLKVIYEKYNIEIKTDDYILAFKNLIRELSKIEKVVLLIDEYDKPIIEYLEDIEYAKEMRTTLKNFYETIKANDEYIHFAFLTGVSKFSKTSVFSSLNNLRDITLSEDFSEIVGINELQLYDYFDEYIEIFAKKEGITKDTLKKALKEWYNGYSWNGNNFIYNPFSILNAFTEKNIKNYWFQSGTPTFLIKLIRKYRISVQRLEKLIVHEFDFDSYEVDSMNVIALLFQTGYLTIKEVIKTGFEREYVLSYPNREVQQSLGRSLLNSFIENNESNALSVDRLVKSLKNENLQEFFKILTAMFGSIPHEIFPEKTKLPEKEAYYHTIFHLIFTLIGSNIKSEVSTSKGRIDSVIETETSVFIFEFKVGRSPKVAIEQIEDKNYYESYLAKDKKIQLIGVSFSISKRNIKDWRVKLLKDKER